MCATLCLVLQVVGVAALSLVDLGDFFDAPSFPEDETTLDDWLFAGGCLSWLLGALTWFVYFSLWLAGPRTGSWAEAFKVAVLATIPAVGLSAVILGLNEALGLQLERWAVLRRVSFGYATLATSYCCVALLALAWRGFERD